MKLSFVVVAYNEEKTLLRLLEDLQEQDYPHERIEVLLIDSMSSDGTRRIMEDFAASDKSFARVAVLENPQKILPCGCNVALKNYTGDALVRIDAHATIPEDFLSKNVRVLESGEMVCGGRRPNIIDEDTPWKQTLLVAEQALLGSGVASYRNSREKCFVSSVFHGMYRREVYDKVGLYDERLSRTEDNDMSGRIRAAGYRICYDPNIISYQHIRSSLKGMLRQKYLNGYWIGKTMGINPHCFSLFHFVPFAFVCGIVLTAILALLGIGWPAALMWSAYGLLMVGNSVLEISRRPFVPSHLLLPILFLLLHVAYGAGSFAGFLQIPGHRKKDG